VALVVQQPAEVPVAAPPRAALATPAPAPAPVYVPKPYRN